MLKHQHVGEAQLQSDPQGTQLCALLPCFTASHPVTNKLTAIRARDREWTMLISSGPYRIWPFSVSRALSTTK